MGVVWGGSEHVYERKKREREGEMDSVLGCLSSLILWPLGYVHALFLERASASVCQ
jgi:hypothetical protein